jgi:general stress protein 26
LDEVVAALFAALPPRESAMSDRAANIAHLAGLIRDIRVAMLTTIAPDGRLVSRPLATQEVEFDGELWFATEHDSGKVAEIVANPHVNIAYASPGRNIYVSVAGRASVVHDRDRIEALWSPAMEMFFHKGEDDRNLCMIRVEADSAEYWEGPGTIFGKALYLALSAVTDDPARLSENALLNLQGS